MTVSTPVTPARRAGAKSPNKPVPWHSTLKAVPEMKEQDVVMVVDEDEHDIITFKSTTDWLNDLQAKAAKVNQAASEAPSEFFFSTMPGHAEEEEQMHPQIMTVDGNERKTANDFVEAFNAANGMGLNGMTCPASSTLLGSIYTPTPSVSLSALSHHSSASHKNKGTKYTKTKAPSTVYTAYGRRSTDGVSVGNFETMHGYQVDTSQRNRSSTERPYWMGHKCNKETFFHINVSLNELQTSMDICLGFAEQFQMTPTKSHPHNRDWKKPECWKSGMNHNEYFETESGLFSDAVQCRSTLVNTGCNWRVMNHSLIKLETYETFCRKVFHEVTDDVSTKYPGTRRTFELSKWIKYARDNMWCSSLTMIATNDHCLSLDKSGVQCKYGRMLKTDDLFTRTMNCNLWLQKQYNVCVYCVRAFS